MATTVIPVLQIVANGGSARKEVGALPRAAGSQSPASRQRPPRLPPWGVQLEAPDALAGFREMPSARETYS